MTDVSVTVCHPTMLDQALYLNWLKGQNIDIVYPRQVNTVDGFDISVARQHAINQYRTFTMMRHYLNRPTSFQKQPFFTFSEELKSFLIEKYYEFDEVFMRRLLGRKLNTRLRKELEEISEETSIHIISCHRQFDNLKRIYKKVVEEIDHGGLVENIQYFFLLPKELANQYARILFVSYNRLKAHKKRVLNLSFSDLDRCIDVLLKHWSLRPLWITKGLDPNFVQEAHELKGLLNYRELLEGIAERTVQHMNESSQRRTFIEASGRRSRNLAFLRMLIRNALHLGDCLSQGKEIRNLFIYLMDDFVVPCLHERWSVQDIDLFFSTVPIAFRELSSLSESERSQYASVFQSLMIGIKLCVNHLYSIPS